MAYIDFPYCIRIILDLH